MEIAVIKTGGKQYKVTSGMTIKIEKLDKKENDKIEFIDLLAGKKVLATVIKHGKSPKVRIVKFRRKTGYKRVRGHRQPFTEIQIEGIK